MWIMQLNFLFTSLISSIFIVSIGLPAATAVGNGTKCQICYNETCPDCHQRCTGGCPDGFGESNSKTKGTVCIPDPNPTTSTSLQPAQGEPTKNCFKCQEESCKSCNVTDQSDVCLACMGDKILQANNTCTNATKDGGGGDGRHDDEDNNGALIGGVVGGVLGGIVVIGLIVLGFICWRRQRRQGKRNMDLGDGSDTSDKGPQHNDTSSSENEVSRPMPKKDEIQMAHDKVTRYTKDPTEHPKLLGQSQRSETAELDDLPTAPLPPQQSYDVLSLGNSEDPQSYSPVQTRKHLESPEGGEEMYVNSATLKASTDSTYGNFSVFQPDYDFPDGPKSNMRVSEVVRVEDRTVQRSDEIDDDPQEVYLNEYVDSPTAALVGEEDDGPQEIYMNGNLESDEIYQNFAQ